MENKGRKYLIILWLAFLAAPLLNNVLHIIKSKDLEGAVQVSPDVTFSIEGWLSGVYQQDKEKYFNDNFGFRSDLIRVHNQLGYSLFDKLNAKSVVLGKDNYLFEKGYIDAYYGGNFIGDSLIDDRIRKIQILSDTFASMGKKMIVVLAPSKVRFYPDKIPDSLRKTVLPGNYERYSQHLKLSGKQVFDCNKYFDFIRDTSRYSLFTQYGTHWSMYGAGLVKDSLQHIIALETSTPEAHPLRTFHINKLPEYTDADIGEALNLIEQLKGGPYIYPTYTLPENYKKIPLRLVSISDSFFWSMIYLNFPSMYESCQFWYYFNEIWPDRFLPDGRKMAVADLNLKSEIDNTDVFIIMVSEVNMSLTGFNFIDQAYDLYCKK
jgi:hypothetical protein